MFRRLLVYAGLGLAALGVMAVLAGVFYLYTVTRDLPSVEALQNYTPPVTTRVYAGNGTVLKNAANRLCLDVPGASAANGAKPIAWACNGGSNQTWRYVPPTTE